MRQRSGGSWELRVFVGVDPETGRRLRRYRSVTVRGSRAEAEREPAAMVASVRAVRSVGVRPSVSELLEAWFAIASTSWAPTTIRQTRSVLDGYLHAHLGGIRVGELTAADIDRTYAALRDRGGMRGQPLAPGTLSRVLSCCGRPSPKPCDGWIWDNPAERAHRIVATRPELNPPTPEELRTLLKYLAEGDPALHTFVTLAAFTGGRRAQLLG